MGVRRVVGLLWLVGAAGCPAAKPELPPAAGSTGHDDDGGSTRAEVDDGDDGSGTSSGEGGPSATDESGRAAGTLVVDVSVLQFGDVELGARQTMQLTLSNTGDEPVGEIGAAPPPEPFAFAGETLGGQWPGEGGDCTPELAGGASCQIALALLPTQFGETTGSIQIESELGLLTVPLAGRGVGSTQNLLVNGDGEMPGQPPPSWTATAGSWEASVPTTVIPHGGVRTIYAVEAWDGPDTTLRQDVSLVEYAELAEGGELRVRVQGWLRTVNSFGDQVSARLVVAIDGAEQPIAATASRPVGAWTSFAFDEVVPAGATSAGVELVCSRIGASEDCDAFFDDVSLVLTYGPR